MMKYREFIHKVNCIQADSIQEAEETAKKIYDEYKADPKMLELRTAFSNRYNWWEVQGEFSTDDDNYELRISNVIKLK